MDTNWFKGRLKDLKKNQDDLARAIGRDRTIVTKMINTGSPALKLDQVHAFARVLQVSPLEILFRAGFWPSAQPPLVAAPILSRVEAGSFSDVPDDSRHFGESRILVQYDKQTIFALRVEGDSMDQVAPPGSYVIVDYTSKALKDRELGVFRRHGEATFKRYRRDETGQWLEPDSTNPRHQSFFPGDDDVIEIIGRVIEIRPERREDHEAA